VREAGHVDGRGTTKRAKALGAARPVQWPEEARVGEAERVRRPVRRRRERQPSRRDRGLERAQVVGDDARDVGVDDQRRGDRNERERVLDGAPLTAAGIVDRAGASFYTARAYRRAAELVRIAQAPIEPLVRAGRVRELRGIGRGIEARLVELVETGDIAELRELEREVTPQLVGLGRLIGLT